MNESIDLTYLKTISGGDKEFELSMIRSVSDEVDQKMESFRDAVLAINQEAIRLNAHSLKNLFAIIGITSLQDAFRRIESEGEQMADAVLRAQLQVAEKDWAEKKESLAKLISSYEAISSQ